MDNELIQTTEVLDCNGMQILSDFCYRTNGSKMPLVIFAHGYKGFKDWGAWSLAMQQLAYSGCFAVKFNFSLNGTTIDNPLEFGDLDAFGRNTYTQEQVDLHHLIDHYSNHPLVDSSQVFLIGHSRGGGSVLLQGYNNPKVSAVICWAGVSDFRKRFPHKELFELWQKDGVFYVENGRTKQMMPHYFSFWLDYIDNVKQLNVQSAAQNFVKPCLLIQGTHDRAIPVKEAELLHQWIKGSKLEIIEGADHVFGAVHPYEEDVLPDHLNQVVSLTAKFIEDQCKMVL